jgi:hypothetical protein
MLRKPPLSRENFFCRFSRAPPRSRRRPRFPLFIRSIFSLHTPPFEPENQLFAPNLDVYPASAHNYPLIRLFRDFRGSLVLVLVTLLTKERIAQNHPFVKLLLMIIFPDLKPLGNQHQPQADFTFA